MTEPSTTKTRFLVISDTHNFQFENPKYLGPDVAFKHPLPKADVLLHCGDLTLKGGLEAYKKALQMLSTIDAELKLVIAGNHDFTLDPLYDYEYRKRNKLNKDKYEEATELMNGPLAKEAGVTYLEEGVHSFVLKNGAQFTVYASPYQPRYWGSFQYDEDQDRFNTAEQVAPGNTSIATKPVPNFPDVDIMMTHGPPRDILDCTFRGENVGCEKLLRAASRARPMLYCFGHIHEGHGVKMVTWKDSTELMGREAVLGEEDGDRWRSTYPEPIYWPVDFGKQTLMVNAAIMDLLYRPTHSPWLIDLDLRNLISE